MLTSVLDAKHLHWLGSYDKAHEEALKEQKYILVLLVDETYQAQEYIKNLFIDTHYIQKINKDFSSVIIHKNTTQSYPIEMLYTLEYPALFFLDREELFLCEPLFGHVTSGSLLKHLESCY